MGVPLVYLQRASSVQREVLADANSVAGWEVADMLAALETAFEDVVAVDNHLVVDREVAGTYVA